VQFWAQAHGVAYLIPPLEVVQEVNSKAFSTLQAPPLADAAFLWNGEDLKKWLNLTYGKRVIKTCFGLAGQGNRLIDEATSFKSIEEFCQREWKHQRPLIAEPWLERCLDFSTQWFLKPTGEMELLGTTLFEVTGQGVYLGTKAGPEPLLFQNYQPFIEEHKKAVYALIEILVRKGFFGHFGVDAFVYRDAQGDLALRSIVEINARQTMSLVALHLQQRWFPKQKISLSFTKKSASLDSLLPMQIQGEKGQNIIFPTKLLVDFL
jgi:hypothetical protein